MLDKESNISKVLNLPGKHLCICGRHKRESRCALPGEVSDFAKCYYHCEVIRRNLRSQQKP